MVHVASYSVDGIEPGDTTASRVSHDRFPAIGIVMQYFTVISQFVRGWEKGCGALAHQTGLRATWVLD